MYNVSCSNIFYELNALCITIRPEAYQAYFICWKSSVVSFIFLSYLLFADSSQGLYRNSAIYMLCIYIPVFGFSLSFTTRFISEVYDNDQYLTHTRLPDSKDFHCLFIQLNLIPQTGNRSQRKYEIWNLFLKTLSNGCYNVSTEGRQGYAHDALP